MKGKRSKGEGTVWQTASGTWRGQIMDGFRDDGKKNIVNFAGSTRSEVLDQIRTYRNQIAENIHVNRSITLNDWADEWYADYQTQVQASTYSSYRYTLKHIKDYFSGSRLCNVIPMDINRFQDHLLKRGYSLSQIRKCRAMLIQIFDAADKNGIVAQNPARKAKILRDKYGTLNAPRMTKDAFTDEEVELLEAGLDDDLIGNSILLMLNTGLRVQELIALTSTDIAEDGSTITVNKAIKTVDGVSQMGPPKSRTSNRIIPVPEHARLYAIFLREHGGPVYIWSADWRNTYYSVGSYRRRYYTAISKVEGVRPLSPHCCRNTYVTRLQAKGVPIDLIARLAGHAEIDTTIIYTHTSEATLQNAVQVLNRKSED